MNTLDDPDLITGWCPRCQEWQTFRFSRQDKENEKKLLPDCPVCKAQILQFQSHRTWKPTAKPKTARRR